MDDVARSNLLLDALAERADIGFQDPDDLEDIAMAELLAEWRDELRWPPASALVSPEEAVDALRTGLEERRRARRALAATGSVAATLLVLQRLRFRGGGSPPRGRAVRPARDVLRRTAGQ